MNKKKDKIVSTALGVTIAVVCCSIGIGYRNKTMSEISGVVHHSDSGRNKVLIIEKVNDLCGQSKEGIYKKLGDPKEVYEDKIYTYIDAAGKYDLLINDKVENMVITLNESSMISSKIMLSALDVKVKDEDMERVTKEGKDTITVYDKNKYKKIYMVCRPNSEILETIKIDMK